VVLRETPPPPRLRPRDVGVEGSATCHGINGGASEHVSGNPVMTCRGDAGGGGRQPVVSAADKGPVRILRGRRFGAGKPPRPAARVRMAAETCPCLHRAVSHAAHASQALTWHVGRPSTSASVGYDIARRCT
jgi:hypothetical protein